MLFTHVLCSLGLFKLKTENQVFFYHVVLILRRDPFDTGQPMADGATLPK